VADAGARPGAVHAYRALIGSRLRSQLVYRGSFGLDVLGSLMIAATDLSEVAILFTRVPVLGGLDAAGAFLVFGLATLGFALANGLCGQLDSMPALIRLGTLEVMMLRPQPLLAQLITNDLTLKRIGGALVGLAAAVAGLARLDVPWTPWRVALLLATPLVAGAVFAALFLAAGAVQFWLVDAAEVTNAFTYGSAYAARYSSAALPLPIRLTFAFVVPTAFTAYLPTLLILGRPGPAWLPSWLGWCAPAVAAAAWAVALLMWRSGIRHYTGAGG
jgi:ABC-2 type transport system permease protein